MLIFAALTVGEVILIFVAISVIGAYGGKTQRDDEDRR